MLMFWPPGGVEVLQAKTLCEHQPIRGEESHITHLQLGLFCFH